VRDKFTDLDLHSGKDKELSNEMQVIERVKGLTHPFPPIILTLFLNNF
jgi:hypothetical protein